MLRKHWKVAPGPKWFKPLCQRGTGISYNSRRCVSDFLPFVAHRIKSVLHALLQFRQRCDAQLFLDLAQLLLLLIQLSPQEGYLILQLSRRWRGVE